MESEMKRENGEIMPRLPFYVSFQTLKRKKTVGCMWLFLMPP